MLVNELLLKVKAALVWLVCSTNNVLMNLTLKIFVFFFFYRKSKSEAPKTPTTPTSPMSPSFSSPGGPLSPHLATGDSIRDKCIEMLAAALRTDSEA